MVACCSWTVAISAATLEPSVSVKSGAVTTEDDLMLPAALSQMMLAKTLSPSPTNSYVGGSLPGPLVTDTVAARTATAAMAKRSLNATMKRVAGTTLLLGATLDRDSVESLRTCGLFSIRTVIVVSWRRCPSLVY